MVVPMSGTTTFVYGKFGRFFSNSYRYGPDLTCRWRKGILNIANGGNISGAASATLTINPVNLLGEFLGKIYYGFFIVAGFYLVTAIVLHSATRLREAIVQLKIRSADEGAILKEQLMYMVERFQPVNLIKSTLSDIVASREIKNDVVGASMGLAAGYLAKVLVGSVTRSPFKKLLGTIAMVGITKAMSDNHGAVQSIGARIFRSIGKRLGGRSHDHNV